MQIKLRNPVVYEVGVGDVNTSKSRQFWGDPAASVTLFEPNALLYRSLVEEIKSFSNVRLFDVAIASENRRGYLVSAGILSYLPDIPSPLNTICQGKLTAMLAPLQIDVNLCTFDLFDTGNIDLLILGMEGAEYTVFEYLKSRPHMIILNNHFANDYNYALPEAEMIVNWCRTNGYRMFLGIPDIIIIKTHSLEMGIISP